MRVADYPALPEWQGASHLAVESTAERRRGLARITAAPGPCSTGTTSASSTSRARGRQSVCCATGSLMELLMVLLLIVLLLMALLLMVLLVLMAGPQ